METRFLPWAEGQASSECDAEKATHDMMTAATVKTNEHQCAIKFSGKCTEQRIKLKYHGHQGWGFGCVLFVLEHCFLYGKIVSGAQGFEKIRTSGLLEEIFWLFFPFLL